MSQVFKAGDRMVLELGEDAEGAPRAAIDFQLLSPLLLGLLLPFMAAQYFDPESLRQMKWPIWIFLLAMFLLCTALFFYTHHFPGNIRSIAIDREARTMEIMWRNDMATASQIVPFSEISALRVRHEHQESGRPKAVPELILKSRPPITLPDSITEDQLRPLRAAIGLG